MSDRVVSIGVADRVRVHVYGPIGSNVEIRTVNGRTAMCEKPTRSYIGVVLGFEGRGRKTVVLVAHTETEAMERVSPHCIEPVGGES